MNRFGRKKANLSSLLWRMSKELLRVSAENSLSIFGCMQAGALWLAPHRLPIFTPWRRGWNSPATSSKQATNFDCSSNFNGFGKSSFHSNNHLLLPIHCTLAVRSMLIAIGVLWLQPQVSARLTSRAIFSSFSLDNILSKAVAVAWLKHTIDGWVSFRL